MPRDSSRSFRHEGFNLGRGKLFGDTDTLERIHFAVAGPAKNPPDSQNAIQKRVIEEITKLFEILAQSRTVFRSLRDNEVFWIAMRTQWGTFQPLNGADLKKISELYVEGRKAFLSNPNNHRTKSNTPSPLKNAVDEWIKLHDEVMAMEPLQHFTTKATLNRNQSEVDKLAASLNHFTLNTESSWLPKYVSMQECVWIADGHIEDQLRMNLTDNGRTKLPYLPESLEDIPTLPHNLSHPRDIKMFLCFTGLTRYDPEVSKHAVFMAPIGFFYGKDRRSWYLATGSLSDKHATFMEFYNYAVRMIKDQGRTVVFGVVTYWTDLPNPFVKYFDTAKKPDGTPWTSRSWYWSDNCLRYGLGIAVCKMPKGQPGYRIVMYDMDYPNLIQHPEVPKTGHEDLDELIVCMREWRDVASTAADHALKDDLKEFWQGGKRPKLLTRDYEIPVGDRDSVESSCAWLWDMVNGHGPGVDADDKEMTRCEFLSLSFFVPSFSPSR